MPLTSGAISQAILNAVPGLLEGPAANPVIGWIGTSVVTWATTPGNVVIQGVTSGTAGAGSVLGNLTVPAQPAPVFQAFQDMGVVGETSNDLAVAVAIGISTSFSAAQYTGASVGVGSGTDVSKVVSTNPATLVPLLQLGIVGASSSIVSFALGYGIANLLLLGTGTGLVTGPFSPTPATGTSTSTPV